LILLTGVLVALSAPAVWAEPPAPPAGAITGTLDAYPKEPYLGTAVGLSGKGCRPNSTVRLDFFDPGLRSSARAEAGGDGSFVDTVDIPSDASAGRAWARATCDDPGGGQRILDATLVVVRPRIVIAWINVLFGAGVALVVAGSGLLLRRGTLGPGGKDKGGGSSKKRRRRPSKSGLSGR